MRNSSKRTDLKWRGVRETLLMASQAQKKDAWIWTELNDPSRQNYAFINGEYPLFSDHAKGAYLWDVDGNRYIDYSMGYGTVLLGHADEAITAAVVAQLERGHCLSPLWRPEQTRLTDLLVSTIPRAEMAFLMKTGSDATTGCVRLARIFTGREKVLRWGYNGWHDWCTPRPGGVPYSTLSNTLEFRYNDIASLQETFRRHRDEVACVIMMPFELMRPVPGFLDEVRAVAHRHGALFILDEMRSGFRLALGGAQEFFRIEADLAAYGKGMANGYAISAIVGKAAVLRGMSCTKMTATYFTSSDAMAAALATISRLKDSDAIDHIWRMGEALQEGLRTLVQSFNIQAEVLGYPPVPFLRFTDDDIVQREAAKRAFFTRVVQHGVLFHPNHHWYVSAAHSEMDVATTLVACREGFRAAMRTLGSR